MERFEPSSFLHAAALLSIVAGMMALLMLPWAFVRPARAQ